MTEHQMSEFSRTGFMPAVEQTEKHMRWIPKKSSLEIWLDYHNHEMELIRTVVPFTVLILQVCILVKVL